MPSLLRWTSLVAGAAILYAIGVRRLHLHDFNVFLALVVAVALAVAGVFVLTRGDRAG